MSFDNLTIYRKIGPDGKPEKAMPYPKQREIIKAVFDPPHTLDPRRINLMCGWGFGKTFLGVDLAQLMLQCGLSGMFLEPNMFLMDTVFLKTWKELIPPELYRIRKKHWGGIITWIKTGAQLVYTHRAITAGIDHTLNRMQGMNLNFYIDDEAATGCNYSIHTSLRARMRVKIPFIRYITLSTPKMGEYSKIIREKGSILFRGKSEDNPHLPREVLADMREHMSLPQQRRDMDGELVALEDMLWNMVEIKERHDGEERIIPWPRGNVDTLHPRFNSSMPWYLFSDFGSATGSDVVVQQVPRSIGQEPRWVIVAELCPSFDASVRNRWNKLAAAFKYPPATIVAGRDINTRGGTDGRTAAYFAQKVWGSVNILPVDEDRMSKQHYYDVAQYMFCAPNGDRRLTIAQDLIERKPTAVFDVDSERGIVEMIEQDQWLPIEKRRETDVLPKGREVVVSHVRDALLNGTMLMRPRQWAGDADRKPW